MKTPDLKPCPCCANDRIVIRYGKSGYTSNVYYPTESGYVQCIRCGLRTDMCVHAKKAVEKWNRRATDENA